jgi:hypothetical protein
MVIWVCHNPCLIGAEVVCACAPTVETTISTMLPAYPSLKNDNLAIFMRALL